MASIGSNEHAVYGVNHHVLVKEFAGHPVFVASGYDIERAENIITLPVAIEVARELEVTALRDGGCSPFATFMQ